MQDRSAIKWAPFNSVINSNSLINELAQEQNKQKHPILTEDKITEIEEYILESFNSETIIDIKYYKNYQFYRVSGYITKLDPINKKIILNNEISLDFSNIIDFF